MRVCDPLDDAEKKPTHTQHQIQGYDENKIILKLYIHFKFNAKKMQKIHVM